MRPTTRWPLPHLNGAQADAFIGGLLVLLLGTMISAFWWRAANPEFVEGMRILLGLIGFLGLLSFLLLAYAAFVEPLLLTVTRLNVPFPLSHPLRIAVVADFHLGPFKGSKWVKHVVHKINTLKPDLILIPGDFLFDPRCSLEPLEPLRELRAPLGVFAVPGNHDAGNLSHFGKPVVVEDRSDDLEQFLTPLGVRMLRNTSVTLTHHGERFSIAGIDDLWSATSDLSAAFAEVPKDVPVVLLTHHPDTMLEEQAAKADLLICGHTHGGQVCFPGGRPAVGVPAVVGKKFAYGLFEISKRTKMFVTRGCGETLLRVRFWCRPEVALLLTEQQN